MGVADDTFTPKLVSFHSHSTTGVPLSSSINSGGTTLKSNHKEPKDDDFRHSNRTTKEIDSTSRADATVDETSQDGSPLFLKVGFPENLPCLPSNTSLESGIEEQEMCDLQNKVIRTMIDADNSQQTGTKVSLQASHSAPTDTFLPRAPTPNF